MATPVMESRRSTNARASSPPRRRRACVPCSKAKARCHFRPENIRIHICDRCKKLGVDCSEKQTKSLRKPRQIKPLNSRVSSLEKQLHQLTSNLSAGSPRPETRSVCAGPSPEHRGSPPSVTTSPSSRQSFISTPATRASTVNQGTPALPPNGLTWLEATVVMNNFRQNYVHRFPCVLIDDFTTPQQLLAEKPFVFRAVMLVAAQISVARSKKMKRNAMAYLGHRLLVEEQRHLDLLQGLLIILSWNDLDWYHDSQVTVLTYTALGLAHSLRLARTPLKMLQQMGNDRTMDDSYQLKDHSAGHAAQSHSMEEQRAFLALFCLVSMNSGQFGRQNPLDHQYVTMCCDNIAQSPGTPYDYFLERLTRMYLIADKLAATFGSPNDNERPQPYLFLVEGQARSIRQELSDIMESIGFDKFQNLSHAQKQKEQKEQNSATPDHNKEHNFYREYFTLHYHYLLVRLYEPATYLQTVPNAQASLYRSACLRNCLFAAKTYFDTHMKISPSTFMYIPLTTREQIWFVMTVATRLMLIDVPDWDLTFARTTLDMRVFMDTLVERVLEGEVCRRERFVQFASEMALVGVEVPDVEDRRSREGPLHASISKLKFLRVWFEAKMAESPTTSWYGEDILGSLDTIGAFGSLNLTTHGDMPAVSQPVTASGISLGMPEPLATVRLDEGAQCGLGFFGEMCQNTPWSFDGVDM